MMYHKYRRGHTVIIGGEMTGAARLAARAARRVGSGLLTIAAAPELIPIFAADGPGNILRPLDDTRDNRFEDLLEEHQLLRPGILETHRQRRSASQEAQPHIRP